MKIIGFGLPKDFPDASVPVEVAHFCAAVDGQELSHAYIVASDRGYKPLMLPLAHLGQNVWFFGLAVADARIPLMVTVELGQPANEGDGHVHH